MLVAERKICSGECILVRTLTPSDLAAKGASAFVAPTPSSMKHHYADTEQVKKTHDVKEMRLIRLPGDVKPHDFHKDKDPPANTSALDKINRKRLLSPSAKPAELLIKMAPKSMQPSLTSYIKPGGKLSEDRCHALLVAMMVFKGQPIFVSNLEDGAAVRLSFDAHVAAQKAYAEDASSKAPKPALAQSHESYEDHADEGEWSVATFSSESDAVKKDRAVFDVASDDAAPQALDMEAEAIAARSSTVVNVRYLSQLHGALCTSSTLSQLQTMWQKMQEEEEDDSDKVSDARRMSAAVACSLVSQLFYMEPLSSNKFPASEFCTTAWTATLCTLLRDTAVHRRLQRAQQIFEETYGLKLHAWVVIKSVDALIHDELGQLLAPAATSTLAC